MRGTVLLFWSILVAPQLYAATPVRLATLEWPPYVGTELRDNGPTASIVTQAFAQMGTSVDITITAWKRAIKLASRTQQNTLGYFPGYHCQHDTQSSFIQSDAIGTAPLGFVFAVDNPLLDWQGLDQLQSLRIGYVTGYGSTHEFEQMEKSGAIKVIRTGTDKNNIDKILAGELDSVLIDKYVYQSLLQLPQYRSQDATEKLRLAEKPLAANNLYVCFTDNEQGREVAAVFAAGLAKIDIAALLQSYFGH